MARAGPPFQAPQRRREQPLGSLRAAKACWCANRERAGLRLPPSCPPRPEQLFAPLQESLKSRVDGASSKAAGSDAASDAGSLGESTAIERRLEPSSSAPCPDSDATPPFSWRGLLQFCGSGLLMSVAYLVGGPYWHGQWVLPWHPCSALQPPPRSMWATCRSQLAPTPRTWLAASVAQDPGNLEADIQAGAKTGFALLW